MMGAETQEAVQRWLRRHHGVITHQEVLRLGGTDGSIRHLVNSGIWRRHHLGVYVVAGMPATSHQQLEAAVAAGGPGTVISHHSAAWLWGMIDRRPAQVHVTVAYPRQLELDRVVCHRSRRLSGWVIECGFPCTDARRTVLDLANQLTPEGLADLVDRGLAARVLSLKGLTAVGTSPAGVNRPGTGALRRSLQDRGMIGGPSPSVLESKALRLFKRHRLPIGHAELVWGQDGEYRLDFAVLAIRLVVEVDGYVWHFSPEHQRRDHVRRNRLTAAGWTLLVHTWRDVVQEPERVAREIERTVRRLRQPEVAGNQRG